MNQKTMLMFVGAGLGLSILMHFCVFFGRIPFEQKYVLYIHAFMVFLLWPAFSFSRDPDSEVIISNPFKTAFLLFPLWLTLGLGLVLVYSALMFINYTYINDPLSHRPDIDKVAGTLSKGSSAATMFFYAAAFGLLNLHWRVKKAIEEEESRESTPD
jgi:magnesium-transporting ATPase (P-type)